MARIRSNLVVVAAVAIVAGACGGDEPSRTAAPPPGSTGVTTRTDHDEHAYFAKLCGVLASVRAGDAAAARAAFDDGPLHELADAAIAVDRSVAARLLEAKEVVESDLADDTTPLETLFDDLLVLTNATLDAYATVGQPVPLPCDQENS